MRHVLIEPSEPRVAVLTTNRPERLNALSMAVARSHVEDALAGSAAHEAARRRTLDFMDAHPDAFHHSCREGHLTASAMVVDPTSERFLLMLHAKVRAWLQPGGHADGDASLPGVALFIASMSAARLHGRGTCFPS